MSKKTLSGWVIQNNKGRFWGVCNQWHLSVMDAFIWRDGALAKEMANGIGRVVLVQDGMVVDESVELWMKSEG